MEKMIYKVTCVDSLAPRYDPVDYHIGYFSRSSLASSVKEIHENTSDHIDLHNDNSVVIRQIKLDFAYHV